ncbi:MAG: winged helix-turn-helix domain-containing protein [Actinobacteria bacterium]|nr:winged helix-turn-helix domain-containing protein [Actinomycetota bacterium]
MASETATSGRPVVVAKLRVPRVPTFQRPRLLESFTDLHRVRLAVIVAPAGYGKTTLLVHIAESQSSDIAWYRAERGEADSAEVLEHLHHAIAEVEPAARGDWSSVESAANTLARIDRTEPLLVVIDDLHEIIGTQAEASLSRLLDYLPAWVTVLTAARRPPAFDLSRLRLAGELIELGPDDLRFRSWEAEDLFRDFYAEPLPPEDIAALTRRTEGWAAGLQLFHLATTGKSLSSRRQVVGKLSTRSKLVHEYLAHNVLKGIPDELGDFLIETCVLGRLDAETCDALRGEDDSADMLADLEQRSLFTIPLEDGTGWRYHEVLRSHLEDLLLAAVGEAEVRARYQLAGRLLEKAGAIPEALHAYSRAEDGTAATRLLDRGGEELAETSGAWLARLPQALLDGDPWLKMAMARRHVANGRWSTAIEAYRAAERTSASERHAELCRRERTRLATWLDPGPVVFRDWFGLLRLATMRDPEGVAIRASRKPGLAAVVAVGISHLLAGSVNRAFDAADEILEDPTAEPALIAGAHLIAALSGWVGHGAGDGANDIRRAAETFETLGVDWAARVTRSALALWAPDGISLARRTRSDATEVDDPWGTCLAGLFEGFGGLVHDRPDAEPFEAAVTAARSVGAGTLEAWARAGAALANALLDGPDATVDASSAATFARTAATAGAQAVAHLALAVADVNHRADHLEAAKALAHDLGWHPARLALPPVHAPGTPSTAEDPNVTLFGGLSLAADAGEVDLGEVRPRARAAFMVLALHAGRPIHRETLIDLLWPGSSVKQGTRSLQVAISALRKLLEAHPGAPTIERHGEAYVLEGARTDLDALERHLERARHANGDHMAAAASLREVLDAYTDEVLPEAGPADWVVRERERITVAVADAAERLADLELRAGDVVAASTAAERGLAVDRYRDRLWKVAIAAAERSGNAADAARLKEQYRAVLNELGIEPG